MPESRTELADRLGPGQLSSTRPVTIAAKLQYPGKEPFLLFTRSARVDSELSEAQVRELYDEQVQERVASFFAKHFPDGQTVPTIIEYQLGHLSWIPDDGYWHRHRG